MARMNLVGKLFQSFVVEHIRNTSWEHGNDHPLVVELDPTAACDLACPGCISEDIVAAGNKFSNDRLITLGEEMIAAGVKGVILIGGGEPLAHPRVGELITLLGDNDVHVGITTNGTFIDRYLHEIAEHSFWTRVSMDAATDQLFSLLRPSKSGKSKFNKIISNMEKLSKVKKGAMGFSYLIQTEADGSDVVSNIHEIFDGAKLARELGCDYFEVKPTYQFRDGIDHALMKHNQDLMKKARTEIARCYELEDENFSILEAINLKASLDGVDTLQPKTYKTCPSTHLRTTLTAGGAYVCPYWRGKQQFMIGDLKQESFAEMWRGQRRQAVMAQLDVSKQCNFHCLRHDTNLMAIDLKNRLDTGEEIELVPEFDRFI